MGPVGVGKTFLATALGHAAIRRRHSVHFERAGQLLKRLKAARLERDHRRAAPRRGHHHHLQPRASRMARPDGRPPARPVRHRPAPVRRLRARPRRRVLPAPAKTSHRAAGPLAMLPATNRGGAAPAPPALPQRCARRQTSEGASSRPGSRACPRTPGTARARSARPYGQTLAAPENPDQPKGCPTEKMQRPRTPRASPAGWLDSWPWSHATGGRTTLDPPPNQP